MSLPTLPLTSVGPMQPGVPANVSVESGKVIRRHVASSKANNRLRMSKKPKNTKHMCNHVHYTPMAELRHHYETVLSWLQPAVIKASRGNIRQKSRQSRSAPESSELPSTRYYDFVDELLDSLVISDLTSERHQPSMTFIDNLLNSL